MRACVLFSAAQSRALVGDVPDRLARCGSWAAQRGQKFRGRYFCLLRTVKVPDFEVTLRGTFACVCDKVNDTMNGTDTLDHKHYLNDGPTIP